MWLDAFIPKSGTMQNIGVPSVPSVPPPAKPMNTRVQGYWGTGTPANVPSVPGVPTADPTRAWDTRDTVGHNDKKRCPSEQIGCKPSNHAGSGVSGTPGTRGTPQKQHEPGIEGKTLASLAQFRFDLMQGEIEAGEPGSELHRVNNMAWEFMQADGMVFEDAIRLAAEIVVSGQVAACEAAYADVMAAFLKATYAKD